MEPIQKRKITRNRELRACVECRTRKLKCDRQSPCSACTKRDEEASCVYEKWSSNGVHKRESVSQVEAKLQHLEELVQELSAGQDATVPSRTATSTVSEPKDLREVSVYNGPTHWSAMLEDIDELRNAITDHEMDNDDGAVKVVDAMDVLFGSSSSRSFQQIISDFLPPRKEADRSVASYFSARAVTAPFIHHGQFQRMYQLFWDDPTSASPLWTSILFSVLDVARRTLSIVSTSETMESVPVDIFAMAAAQCLVVGQYHKPQKFGVEALLLFAQAHCLACLDVTPVYGVLFGTLIRLATSMGYHRDPASSANGTTVFECEMRRRTWSLCMQLDLLISFQLGLPSNVQYPTWDTKPPTNLLDLDFAESSVQLPPARAQSEPTELLFYIAKHRLMTVFEKIMRHALSPIRQAGQQGHEIQDLEQELRNTYSSMPVIFQPRPVADSVVDPASIIVTRLCLSSIYQKSLIVLHRKYVVLEHQESIETCFDAAAALVDQFLDAYYEFKPGGQLYTERWFIGSISWHDFLLGCSALCLTVCSILSGATTRSQTLRNRITSNTERLDRVEKILTERCHRSQDTRRVGKLVQAVVAKISAQNYQSSYQYPDASGSAIDYQTMTEANSTEFGPTSPTGPLYDSAWEYMDQFLDLSGADLLDDHHSS